MIVRRASLLLSATLASALFVAPSCATVERTVRGPVEAVVTVPTATPGVEDKFIVEASANRSCESGVRAFRNQDWEVAITAFQQALRDDPEDYEAHFALGVAYEMTGNLQAALEHYQTANSLPRQQNLQYITAIERVRQKLAR